MDIEGRAIRGEFRTSPHGNTMSAVPNPISRRSLILSSAGLAAGRFAAAANRIPAKTVVLTFDDAVKSHRHYVAPMLKKLGFGATFFVSHGWMTDTANFMSWQEIAEIHGMGFEIGNHTWTHSDFSSPRNAARLDGELSLVEYELNRVKVPRPASFAWPGNNFGPEALAVLKRRGFRFARRGVQPEAKYGSLEVGAPFRPDKHDPLFIPTTGDAYPNWTDEHLPVVLERAVEGQAVVLQFHGVPDIAHPWVHTPPENFARYMQYLADNGYRVIAIRDLEPYLDRSAPPADPITRDRFPAKSAGLLPVEVEATRADLPFWLPNMARDHGYTTAEVALVCGFTESEAETKLRGLPPAGSPATVRIRPYPGGRHPRIGFLDGAVSPLRGTKFSVFLPWDATSYAVVDLPEAIFSNLGLLYLAHTHIPTIWNDRNQVIDNVDWQRPAEGELRSQWKLPNGVLFGASAKAAAGEVAMELWLTNGTAERLTGLRSQVCVMLKSAAGFAQQTNENKKFETPLASVEASSSGHRLLTSWERSGRTWGNPEVPCLHSDPVLPDCDPGQTVSVHGRLWFE